MELDDYEVVNLLWLMRLTGVMGLDTGDWHHQITRKLKARGHGNITEANWSDVMTKNWLAERLCK